MKVMQRIIYTGFAAVAIASASMPVFPAHDMASRPAVQGPDFAWFADVGRPDVLVATVAPQPPAREGYIWSPQRWEWNGREHVWTEGRWVRDDYAEQVALYNLGAPAVAVAEAPPRTVFIERR
jgi:hypothetical protein